MPSESTVSWTRCMALGSPAIGSLCSWQTLIALIRCGSAGGARTSRRLRRATIVTTAPSKFAGHFHNRMPLVLEPDTWDLWMKSEPDAAAALMKPANEDVLTERLVSKAAGNVKNNGPELLDAT